jgi:hypothetical protein
MYFLQKSIKKHATLIIDGYKAQFIARKFGFNLKLIDCGLMMFYCDSKLPEIDGYPKIQIIQVFFAKFNTNPSG